MVTERNTGSKAQDMRRNNKSYLTEFGTTVTVKRNTRTLDSMNKTSAITPTTTPKVKADIQWVNKWNVDRVNAGDVKVGDGQIFFLYDEDIQLDDEITYNNIQWRIVSQIEGEQVKGKVIYQGWIIRKNAQT